MLTSGALRPIIGKTFSLQKASQSFEELAKGIGNGKIVLSID